jgi:hypothetical protein
VETNSALDWRKLMQNIVGQLVGDVYQSVLRKWTLFNPQRNGWLPPEENIAFEIARCGSLYGYESYGECNIGHKKRADMVLLHPSDQWICHVEIKIARKQNVPRVIDDLQRVSDPQSLQNCLSNVSTSLDLSCYKRFGLFVGADLSGNYKWWEAASGSTSSRQWFLRQHPNPEGQRLICDLNCYRSSADKCELLPKAPKTDYPWMVYHLFKL